MMLYKRLGNSGLKVSELCLGTMTFGKNSDRPGNCDEAASHKIMDRFVELGGNFVDTADVYCNGESEEIVGTWLKKMGPKREEIVLATKARFKDALQGPINGACLSRKHLLSEVEESLKRLQVDYIDLYQWHCWDASTPLEESLRVMDDLIKSGKVRYFGVSNFCGWQLQKLMDLSKHMGLNPCISLQQQYSLLNRELELELADVCTNENVAVLPWSPLKGGWLTGKFDRSMTEPVEGTRVHYSTVKNKSVLQSHPDWQAYANNDQVWDLLDTMKGIADSKQKSVSQVALRWLCQKKAVTSPVIGVKTLQQLEDCMGAVGWELSAEDMQALDNGSQYTVPYPYNMINRMNKLANSFK